MKGGIPLIDFAKCGLAVDSSAIDQKDIEEVGKQLYGAFSTSGFAYIANTGIGSEKVAELNEITARFFALSLDEKLKHCTKSLAAGGYDPTGRIRVNPDRDIDLQEAYRVTGESWEEDSKIWPNLPEFRETIAEFMDSCKVLLMRILKALGTGMKLKDPEYFCKHHALLNKKGNTTTLDALRYPPVPTDGTLLAKQIRLGEHTDSGSITLLFQDEKTGGLQVQNEEGVFEDASPIPGTIVLNVGDCFQHWSGKRLKSTYHRVVPPEDPEIKKRTRRSVVYFGIPDDDALLTELEFEDNEVTVATDNKPMTTSQYLEKRFVNFYKYDETQ